MPDVTAFKDWAVMCDAMGSGRQSVILRKGGIAEGRESFQFKHREFFLYPTAYHEQVSRLRPGLAEGLRAAPAARDGSVEIRELFQLDWHAMVTRWDAARALEPFHLYREEVVRERFDYDASPGLQVAFGRGFRLATPWRFPDEARFGGCRSWIKLPSDAPAPTSLIPALADDVHTTLAVRLEAWAARFDISVARFTTPIHS